MRFTRILVLLAAMQLLAADPLFAEETDQFTLPPQDLRDIGPSSSRKLSALIESVIAQTNREIHDLKLAAPRSRHAAKALAKRKKGQYLADLLYKKTGPGFPRWLRWDRDQNKNPPVEYKELRPWKTVYWLVFTQSPFFLVGLAPTINLYGIYFGTDKLGHFFMQGHTYYSLYNYCLQHGKTPEQAHAAMILYGQVIEQTYLGTLINGVYSNADLSANYAGWKFYTNLSQSVKIGSKTLPPIATLQGDTWVFSKERNPNTLLKPYLSENLNEALNPSRYSFMRWRLRQQIEKRCPEWINRRGITLRQIQNTLANARHWHGEDYGYWLPENNKLSLEFCFTS